MREIAGMFWTNENDKTCLVEDIASYPLALYIKDDYEASRYAINGHP